MTATASLLSLRLSLLPWLVERGRWTACELQNWEHFVGESPLSLSLRPAGVLLWPPRPHSLVTRGQGTISLVIYCPSCSGLWGVHWANYIGLSPLWRDVLLGGVVNFVPRLAITILGVGVAMRRLPISKSTKKPYEALNDSLELTALRAAAQLGAVIHS